MFEGTDARTERCRCAINCSWRRIFRGCGFNFGDESGTDYCRISETAKHGNMTRLRNAEAHCNRQLRNGAGATKQRGEIFWKRIFRASDAGARNEIEESRRNASDLSETFVGGSGSAEEDRVETVRVQDAAVFLGLFGSQICREGAVGAGLRGGGSKFLESHLENRIVIAEKDDRDIGRRRIQFANLADEIENIRESRSGPECTFRGALDCRAVGKRIAEGHAKFDDVCAGLRKGLNKFQSCAERRVASGDVRDDAHFAVRLQFRETPGDTCRNGSRSRHKGMK